MQSKCLTNQEEVQRGEAPIYWTVRHFPERLGDIDTSGQPPLPDLETEPEVTQLTIRGPLIDQETGLAVGAFRDVIPFE